MYEVKEYNNDDATIATLLLSENIGIEIFI
jgi:hypothetical protein